MPKPPRPHFRAHEMAGAFLDTLRPAPSDCAARGREASFRYQGWEQLSKYIGVPINTTLILDLGTTCCIWLHRSSLAQLCPRYPEEALGITEGKPTCKGATRTRSDRTVPVHDRVVFKPALRRRCQAGLNKGEAAHKLKRAVFFHERGEIRDRSFESQPFRVSGLNLVVSAIVHWNTVYLDRAVTRLKQEGVRTRSVRNHTRAKILNVFRGLPPAPNMCF